jgi:hypothetical protein
MAVSVGLRPLCLHLLSQPKGGSLYVFGNGGPAQGERFADGVKKMADAEVHLSVCCGGWPRPQFRCRSPEDVNPGLFVIRQRFPVQPVLLSRFVVLFLCLQACLILSGLSGVVLGHCFIDTLPTVGMIAATGRVGRPG